MMSVNCWNDSKTLVKHIIITDLNILNRMMNNDRHETCEFKGFHSNVTAAVVRVAWGIIADLHLGFDAFFGRWKW